MALYVSNKTMTYFDSFEVENIPKEVKKFIIKLPNNFKKNYNMTLKYFLNKL